MRNNNKFQTKKGNIREKNTNVMILFQHWNQMYTHSRHFKQNSLFVEMPASPEGTGVLYRVVTQYELKVWRCKWVVNVVINKHCDINNNYLAAIYVYLIFLFLPFIYPFLHFQIHYPWRPRLGRELKTFYILTRPQLFSCTYLKVCPRRLREPPRRDRLPPYTAPHLTPSIPDVPGPTNLGVICWSSSDKTHTELW